MTEPASSSVAGRPGAWAFGAWIGTLVALLIVLAWLLGKDEGRRQAERAGPQTPAAAATQVAAPAAPPGQERFVTTCGGCHTLAAAKTSGTVGPDLDALKPDAARVRAAIEKGGTGSGGMPKDLVTGAEAEALAAYVAKVAG
ncbi:MAG TPA: cytochrome c [Solirubrobacter sp.]|nr:cytochrome c [Solirubrobacter sp.]